MYFGHYVLIVIISGKRKKSGEGKLISKIRKTIFTLRCEQGRNIFTVINGELQSCGQTTLAGEQHTTEKKRNRLKCGKFAQ